jgi:hypothetical protein
MVESCQLVYVTCYINIEVLTMWSVVNLVEFQTIHILVKEKSSEVLRNTVLDFHGRETPCCTILTYYTLLNFRM